MTDQSASVETMYDPDRPWISGPDEDPNRANWFAEFFNPAGETAKPVFLRGQMFLAIARLPIVAGAFAITMGSPWAGAVVAAFGVGLLMIMSIIQHVRRLADAGRPILLALFILAPFLLASASTIMHVQMIPAELEAAAEARAAAQAAREARANAPATEAVEETPEAAPGPRRRGPPPTVESKLTGAIHRGILTWFGLSLVSMIFSFVYVARRPRAERVEERRTSL